MALAHGMALAWASVHYASPPSQSFAGAIPLVVSGADRRLGHTDYHGIGQLVSPARLRPVVFCSKSVALRSSGSLDWFMQLYPTLSPARRPLECMQQPGDLMYLPDGW
jgi:hypothetical protein